MRNRAYRGFLKQSSECHELPFGRSMDQQFEAGSRSREHLPADSCMVNRQAHDDLMHVQMFMNIASMEAHPSAQLHRSELA